MASSDFDLIFSSREFLRHFDKAADSGPRKKKSNTIPEYPTFSFSSHATTAFTWTYTTSSTDERLSSPPLERRRGRPLLPSPCYHRRQQRRTRPDRTCPGLDHQTNRSHAYCRIYFCEVPERILRLSGREKPEDDEAAASDEQRLNLASPGPEDSGLWASQSTATNISGMARARWREEWARKGGQGRCESGHGRNRIAPGARRGGIPERDFSRRGTLSDCGQRAA
ncbi:hypothetical protein B0T11DRAFT_4265 [Plectosphaerella cucumerina]|uniref:Uncharacterized protein n=1 Tax=Plectosphaerella cucumerina TaxID=40658 RepID=A0A8K0TM89_9PEZI|nr:hypothetical protein B0T11DRAFT_4265 [Plectosphaerella cucumerina]